MPDDTDQRTRGANEYDKMSSNGCSAPVIADRLVGVRRHDIDLAGRV